MRPSRFQRPPWYAILYVLTMSLTLYTIKLMLFPGKRHASTAKTSLEVSPEHAPLESVAPFQSMNSLGQTTKMRVGKRIFTFARALVLIAIIAAVFLYSVQSYSDTLVHMGSEPVKAAQPAVQHPVFERGIIYPQWSPSGYGAQDTTWQQGVAQMKEQTGARWIEIIHDAHIAGTFFWGWNNVGMFTIVGQPATQVLLKWYSLSQA